MEFKKYHKIRQYRDIVRDVQFKSNFKGLDEKGEPIYEDSRKPVLRFTGTVKLHGTNAQISYNPKEGLQAGKRNSLLPTDNLGGHFGFNQFVLTTRKDFFTVLLGNLFTELKCGKDEQLILYGEWAGNGIQKGVAISELPKSFYIFGLKRYHRILDVSEWVDIKNVYFDKIGTKVNIYSIYEFPIYSINIDFNKPALFQNELVRITSEVEKECPVAKQLGKSGIGEGVVWTANWYGERLIFKVKGGKHSISKVKKLASVDPEVVKNIYEFVDYACTENRIKQGIQETEAKDKKDTPDLLRWVANDIMAEEDDVLVKNNLEWKQVAREVSNRVRQYFFAKIDKI